MAARRTSFWPIVTAIIGLLAFLIALPQSWKAWMPSVFSAPSLHLGLDLAGGTQLDFRISEEEIRSQVRQVNAEIDRLERQAGPSEELGIARAQLVSLEEQQRNIVEAIRTVLERRINALGVSEATITPSYVGDEKHLLVECPGVVDVQECIRVVGKTIQLEFKEQQTEATAEYVGEVRAEAAAAMRRITESGASLLSVGEDLSSELGVGFQRSQRFFRDQVPTGLGAVWTQSPGRVVLREGSVRQQRQNEQGEVEEIDVPGIFITEVLQPPTGTGRTIQEAAKAFQFLAKSEPNLEAAHHENKPLTGVDERIATALRSIAPGSLKEVQADDTAHILFLTKLTPGGEQIEASHILVAYAGATGAGTEVKRTKEQASEKARQLKANLDRGTSFDALARTESDGPSRIDGGKLGAFGRGVMAPPFEAAAFALQKPGQISDLVETQFGYHIIRLDKTLTTTPDRATWEELVIRGPDAATRMTDIAGRLQRGDVRTVEPAIALRVLFFSLEPTGWKDTPLDGKHFKTATVTTDNVTNIPVVQIVFDAEGGKLFQELTKRNIGKQLAIFVGGELVSAPRVQEEIAGGIAVITGSNDFNEARLLAQELNTGAIPAPIYLVGQHTIEATLGDAALRTSLLAALIGTIILMVYMMAMYRVLGIMAALALLCYAVLFFAILKMPLFLFSRTYIVLTLAGMAGIILSIGMAVDANVLVFERMKEELRKGKMVKTAIESSFKHAWPAIRDGNVSALITCAILFIVGTSIVRGFAITLSMGVLLSMFTAVTITRWLLRQLVKTRLADRPELFGGKRAETPSQTDV